MKRYPVVRSILIILGTLLWGCGAPVYALTYYVSSSLGNDGNDGRSQTQALQTLSAANALALDAGDRVLLKCGDTWRKESLRVTRSGAAASEILYSTYPADCTSQPVISGSLPVTGWQPHAGNIYVADLAAGENAARFGAPPTGEVMGLNQLFRDGDRLLMGRWPNLEDAHDNGYATIDAQPSDTTLVDNQLPDADWSRAVVHLKSMRWLILNRLVTSSAGSNLTLGASTSCYGGTCAGWGYFINHALATLDQDGEWFYDEDAQKVYLYSDSGLPTEIEGSVILAEDPRGAGGIVIGGTYPVQYVIIENLHVKNGFAQGITTPAAMRQDGNAYVTIRNNTISDVDDTGLRLISWINSASVGPDCHRGGHDLQISGNTIRGANHFGIDTFSYDSVYTDNVVRNIGLIENLNKSGLGCGYSGASCTENGDGIRIRSWNPDHAGFNNRFQYNRIERTGYNGMDVFGAETVIENNYFTEVCHSKGDCGAVRTFGGDDLASTGVHDITIRANIVYKSIGNTDGTIADFRPLFGMGLYIDHHSRDVLCEGNTIVDTTIAGISYGSSTGIIRDNVVYDAANNGEMYASCIAVYGTGTQIAALTGNVMYALNQRAWTLGTDDSGKLLVSDNNYFFHPFVENQVCYRKWDRVPFAQWQKISGLDSHSKANWFMLSDDSAPLSRVFFNPQTEPHREVFGLRKYLDLDRQTVMGSLILDSWRSKVLVDHGATVPNAVYLLLQ